MQRKGGIIMVRIASGQQQSIFKRFGLMERISLKGKGGRERGRRERKERFLTLNKGIQRGETERERE